MKRHAQQDHGFVRIGAAVPTVYVGNPKKNVTAMLSLAEQAETEKVQLLAFPELGITGYTAGDLFGQRTLLEGSAEALQTFLSETRLHACIYIVGMPLVVQNQLFNVAVVCKEGDILGVVPKTHIPNYKEFYEARWFQPASALKETAVSVCARSVPIGTDLVFDTDIPGFSFGIDICEDIWMPNPPGARHALHGATVLVNISASNETVAKSGYRHLLVASQSGRCIGAQIYVSSGPTESTSDVVFGGDTMIYVNGNERAASKRFSLGPQIITTDVDVEALVRERMITGSFGQAVAEERTLYRHVPVSCSPLDVTAKLLAAVDPHPFVPEDSSTLDERCEEILEIQTTGLGRRLATVFKEKSPDIYIGISGGLDSTLALFAAIRAYRAFGWNPSGIHAVTMPGPGTTGKTLENALKLCKQLGVDIKTIPITEHVANHLRALGHEPCWECLQCENAQARERTQILMDLGFTIGTGDLSEIALGWCTYNGDQYSMYNPNCGVPKTLVRHLIGWIADHEKKEVASILTSILETPVSPELKKVDHEGKSRQSTERELGPYELHDFFLFNMLRNGFSPRKIFFLASRAFAGTYGKEEILKTMKTFYSRFFSNQFKRDGAPDGPKVGSVSLSQRGDWRMPSDIDGAAWMEEINNI